jgi:tryptophanyl-tRNA synthetase
MSKSDKNDNSRINLTDSPDIIRKKFARSVTDSGTEIKFDVANKPGVSNLLNILSVVTQKSISELEKEYTGKNYGEFKADVAEAVINLLEPVQKKFKELDNMTVVTVLKESAKKVAPTAQETLKRVKKTVGLGI